MAYLNCGRCGLEIRTQADYLRIDNCPRCLARSAIVAPMTVSPGGVTHAAWRSASMHGAARLRRELRRNALSSSRHKCNPR